MAFCFAQHKCLSQTGTDVGVFFGRSFLSVQELCYICSFGSKARTKGSSLEPVFSLKEGGSGNHRMKERHRGNFFVNVYAKFGERGVKR